MSSRDIPKTGKKKRPPKRGTAIVVRLQDDMLESLDTLRAGESSETSRPEMLRRLLDQALGAGKKKARS
jgi:hypothetical protein